MRSLSRKSWAIIAIVVGVLCTLTGAIFETCMQNTALSPQQIDPNFDASVVNPAFSNSHPIVLVDQAHNNFHTIEGSYKPFADLLRNDGYAVLPNDKEFSLSSLENASVLVIVNALGSWGGPAFSEAECNAVAQWVSSGGSLLLIADHNPFGGAAQILSSKFGVNMSEGSTIDKANADLQDEGNPGWLIFSRQNSLLGNDSITQGRNANETVNTVETFAGQSLKGPPGSIAFLKLSNTAVDILPSGQAVSAAGRAQGVALQFGKGRVIVLGEAGMMTAQLTGGGTIKAGMNRPGNDDKQLALNIMHWLSGLLP